jgi:hypothetical protein
MHCIQQQQPEPLKLLIVTTPPPVAIDTNDQLSPLHTAAEEYGYSPAASAQQTSIKADPMAVDSGTLLS